MKLVGARGFEPPTSRSRTERSTRLSHAPTTRRVYTGRRIAAIRNPAAGTPGFPSEPDGGGPQTAGQPAARRRRTSAGLQVRRLIWRTTVSRRRWSLPPPKDARADERRQSGIDHAHMRGLATAWRRYDRRLTSLYRREFPVETGDRIAVPRVPSARTPRRRAPHSAPLTRPAPGPLRRSRPGATRPRQSRPVRARPRSPPPSSVCRGPAVPGLWRGAAPAPATRGGTRPRVARCWRARRPLPQAGLVAVMPRRFDQHPP